MILKLLDNMYQDIPLISVLGSVFGFTPEQLAEIRACKRRRLRKRRIEKEVQHQRQIIIADAAFATKYKWQ